MTFFIWGRGGTLLLDGCLGFELRLVQSMSKECNCGQTHWWSHCAWRGECGPCPVFALYLAFTLQLRQNHRKTSVGYPKVPSCTVLGTIHYVELATVKQWPTRLACWSWSPLWLKQPGSTSISVGICRISELRVSPHRLTLSQNSRLGLWCGQQRMELPNPREFSCYQCTRVHPWWKLQHQDSLHKG